MTDNDLGIIPAVEYCRSVTVAEIVDRVKESVRHSLIQDVTIDGVAVKFTTTRTGNNGTRYWFACPMCARRVGVLYRHPISDDVACRHCLGLSYRKQLHRGMVEAEV